MTSNAWTIEPQDLAPGATVSVHLTSPTTSASCSTLDHTSSVSTTSDGAAQDSSSITLHCGAIALFPYTTLFRSSAGDPIGFTVTVHNAGAGIARGASATDTLPNPAGTTWSIDAPNTTGA